jgi:hypothetical protein
MQFPAKVELPAFEMDGSEAVYLLVCTLGSSTQFALWKRFGEYAAFGKQLAKLVPAQKKVKFPKRPNGRQRSFERIEDLEKWTKQALASCLPKVTCMPPSLHKLRSVY